MVNDVEHLSVCLLAICMVVLWNICLSVAGGVVILNWFVCTFYYEIFLCGFQICMSPWSRGQANLLCTIELKPAQLFMYSGFNSFFRYMYCKYFFQNYYFFMDYGKYVS